MTREAVLGAIRRGLRRGALPADQATMIAERLSAHPRHLIPDRTNLRRDALVALFVSYLEREFGTAARISSADDVPAAVADYLAANNLPTEFVLAPHPALQGLPWPSRPLLRPHEGRASDSDVVSVQHAFAGIAETGTLVFPSSPTRPTTLNLLPDTQIAVLVSSRIVGPYEDVWDLLRADYGPGLMPRSVMFVTGPSRSADIEQTLELGAHGPRRLHVILIEDG